MTKKNLESFKIADTQKLGVRSTGKKGTTKNAPQDTTVGFARIEKLLESEEPEGVNARLNVLHASLRTLSEGAKANKDKSAAEKAMAAVERTADLMGYLFQTKAQMAQEALSGSPKGKKSR